MRNTNTDAVCRSYIEGSSYLETRLYRNLYLVRSQASMNLSATCRQFRSPLRAYLSRICTLCLCQDPVNVAIFIPYRFAGKRVATRLSLPGVVHIPCVFVSFSIEDLSNTFSTGSSLKLFYISYTLACTVSPPSSMVMIISSEGPRGFRLK